MPPPPDNPLWEFSVEVYSQPGVADYCLTMQDDHLALVNLMLFCCWAGASNVRLDKTNIRNAEQVIAQYNTIVTCQCRAQRRKIVELQPGAEALKKRWLARELEAERTEQGRLYNWFCTTPLTRSRDGKALITHNLKGYLQLLGVDCTAPNPLIGAAENLCG